MRTVTSLAEAQSLLDDVRGDGGRVGFVPTMGFLHAGHASLMTQAAADCDLVVASLFVNPLQFAPDEDLDSYPQDRVGDAVLAAGSGVDLLFCPSVQEMYGDGLLTTVAVAELATRLEGASRPTHFTGVTTVVAKLFNIAGQCRAYFGEKDWQQLAIITCMVRDLSFPVEVIGCPTVRDADGLALSSRNAYLSPPERAAAPVIRHALLAGAAAVEEGERDPATVRAVMTSLIACEPLARLDYAEVVAASDLAPVEPLRGEVRLLAAVSFGRARLIDNVAATAP